MAEKKEVLQKSSKANTTEAKEQRKAQAVGKIKLNDTSEFEVKKDTKHLRKGEKIKLNKPTAALFRAKGIV